DLTVETVVSEGSDVAEQIVLQSRARAADLIVMGTHGRVGLGRAVLGSVTERVLPRSRLPIMVLRPGGRRISHIRNLLVPIDGSPGGAFALGLAVALARATGASMKLLQVATLIPDWVWAGDAYGGLAYYDPAWDEEALAAARAYVDGI